MTKAARVLLILCGLGSLACTFYAGHHNRSIALVLMFAAWVAAPFAGMLGVLRGIERTIAHRAARLQTVTIVSSIAALGLYAAFTLHPMGHSAAAPFLLIPAGMWVVIAGLWFSARGDPR